MSNTVVFLILFTSLPTLQLKKKVPYDLELFISSDDS